MSDEQSMKKVMNYRPAECCENCGLNDWIREGDSLVLVCGFTHEPVEPTATCDRCEVND